MSVFFRQFQHLLPNSKAWNLTKDKLLRQFFEGLTGLGGDFKLFQDQIFQDIFPETTRQLDEWELQFGLIFDASLSEQERRDRLLAAWRAVGGQSPRYIQDILQDQGFPVFLHPWWEIPRTEPLVPHNPLPLLISGGLPLDVASDGTESAQDGRAEMQDGGQLLPPGYPLVNKIVVLQGVVGQSDGNPNSQDGRAEMQDGRNFEAYSVFNYVIPTDPDLWHYFLYVGGEVFPDTASIPASRRVEFETLLLKLCPAQQWLGVLVEYS